jgi:hypothetical protein
MHNISTTCIFRTRASSIIYKNYIEMREETGHPNQQPARPSLVGGV